jgi:hypothetical protein
MGKQKIRDAEKKKRLESRVERIFGILSGFFLDIAKLVFGGIFLSRMVLERESVSSLLKQGGIAMVCLLFIGLALSLVKKE